MESILDKIVAAKRVEIQQAKAENPEGDLRGALDNLPAARDFFDALAADGPIKLIAEIKKASPSAGLIREDFDPATIASTYAQHGATCLSVLTDEQFFAGSLENLRLAREAVEIPVLRKDFILDSYQLVEARVAGADAVLLIAECLSNKELKRLFDEAIDLGLTPLVELYDAERLSAVLACGARLVGVNNRDLRTFEVDLDHTIRLRERIPADCVLVAESGVRTHADVTRLEQAGVNAILVGESLMREDDIGAAVDRLLGRPGL
ncbi:Indole-3-glycerol phosphate synthase [Pirellulimonas nuda]|uniref:Indole-3-glycerol phosphate synthase n=1 Tax=Pirellulimonas nuda TaxID=2528009 RepID=A0A518DH72_9BACT|nr:indole-3-glycerol phosphate synthase TrpC [Pirellulimonas nuda]QDU90828.1 Indole-3-glycerol phosphate synthase [Pirellulimonas nuda]